MHWDSMVVFLAQRQQHSSASPPAVIDGNPCRRQTEKKQQDIENTQSMQVRQAANHITSLLSIFKLASQAN